MNANAFVRYAMDSLLESVESVCDLFLVSQEEVAKQITSTINGCIEDFQSSCCRAYHGTEEALEGLAGILLAPASLIATLVAIPLLAVFWVSLFLLCAIAHTATVPMVYIWVLLHKTNEASVPQKSTNYFPEVLEPTPAPVVTHTPPVLVLSALAVMASMGVEIDLEPANNWTPSFIPAPIVAQETQAEELDIKTFRVGLERQFAIQPTRTWKEYILQNLIPAETLTAQIESESERSLSLEVSTAPKFPAKPHNKVLQRWDKDQLLTFCDRINAIKKGSITKYKSASKTLLIKKIKEFYA